MRTLQDTYKELAKKCLASGDGFGYSYWCKRIKEVKAYAN